MENPTFQKTIDIIGVKLHSVTISQLHDYMQSIIESGRKALVLNLNVHCVNLCQKNKWLKNFINQAHLVFCDGDGVRWGARLLGYPAPPKITYDRWIWSLSNWAEQNKYTLYFLGGKPGVASEAADNLRTRIPNLKIVGIHHGYFQKHGRESEEILLDINSVTPDILIVGFGMPIQEKWLMNNWQKINAHIFLTGGAVFDYASGRAKRAPNWVIKMNVEWFFRFLQEPKRLFMRYFFGNPFFITRILQELFKRVFSPRS